MIKVSQQIVGIHQAHYSFGLAGFTLFLQIGWTMNNADEGINIISPKVFHHESARQFHDELSAHGPFSVSPQENDRSTIRLSP